MGITGVLRTPRARAQLRKLAEENTSVLDGPLDVPPPWGNALLDWLARQAVMAGGAYVGAKLITGDEDFARGMGVASWSITAVGSTIYWFALLDNWVNKYLEIRRLIAEARYAVAARIDLEPESTPMVRHTPSGWQEIPSGYEANVNRIKVSLYDKNNNGIFFDLPKTISRWQMHDFAIGILYDRRKITVREWTGKGRTFAKDSQFAPLIQLMHKNGLIIERGRGASNGYQLTIPEGYNMLKQFLDGAPPPQYRLRRLTHSRRSQHATARTR